MTFTDEQLWAAVRSAGGEGQSFTCATLREQMGVTSTKRNDLQQFRDRFRAFRLAAGEEIEKVGKSAYRLKPAAAATTPIEDDEATENLIEIEVFAVPDDPEAPIERPSGLEHPVAVAEADLGFGESLDAFAADSGELAANHVIFSAWPEERSAAAESEAAIEAEVRELVSASEQAERRHAPESLFAQAEQAVVRTWRDGGHWLGRRFSQLFHRN